MAMVKNEGKKAFIIMNVGFLFKTNDAFNFDPFFSRRKTGSWISNWFNTLSPEKSKYIEKCNRISHNTITYLGTLLLLV